MRTYIYNEKYSAYSLKRILPSCVILIIIVSSLLLQNILIGSQIKNSNVLVMQQVIKAQTKNKNTTSSTTVIDNNKNNQTLQSQEPITNKTHKIITTSTNWQAPVSVSDLLISTNAIRAQNGLSKLTLHTLLSASATAKCRDMADRNYWSHIDPDGREPWYFIDKTGYIKLAAGENLAYGFKDTQSIIDGWMNSVEHKAVILNATYQDIGFGICSSKDYQNSGQQIIVVQHFGAQL